MCYNVHIVDYYTKIFVFNCLFLFKIYAIKANDVINCNKFFKYAKDKLTSSSNYSILNAKEFYGENRYY